MDQDSERVTGVHVQVHDHQPESGAEQLSGLGDSRDSQGLVNDHWPWSTYLLYLTSERDLLRIKVRK